MLVFLFTDIEGSTRLWEEHTAVMTAVIARHDEILRELVTSHGGRITKHTGDGITAVFDGGQPLACALQAQVRFAAEPWDAVGALPIRAGLHAGAAEFHASAGTPEGDYFGPPVNATARVMAAAWGGQILLTPAVTQASPLPDRAGLLDLGEHLLKNVSAPQQLYQLLHPQLPCREFPPPRTLSGQSIRQAVDQRGAQIVALEPQAMGLALLVVTLLPTLQGELDPESGTLEGNLGVLENLGARFLRGFLASFAERLRAGGGLPTHEMQARLQAELQARWQAGGEAALALRADASRLLQAVHGVDAAMTAASGELKEALARGLAGLGTQFGEFRWMLAGVQDTLAEVRARQTLQLALQREQLDLQRQQLVKTNLLLHRQPGTPLTVQAPAEGPSANVPPAPAVVPCPYMGLAAFEADDAEFFFGREEIVAELTARLAGTRFLAVVGPSGSGKSSLVRAGLLPAVWAGALPGSGEWQTLVLTPGAHPLEELAVRVSLLHGISPGSLLRDLQAGPQALHLAVKQLFASGPDDAKLLLVVDQFEEIFALCREEAERQRFIEALLYAVEAEKGRTVVVSTIRADFYGRCADYADLAGRLSDGLLVGPMSEQELRAAIERPAAVVGLRLEPGLTGTILDEVAGEPGALPLLSHALLETFERRRGADLTLSGYAASGGVAGAIAQTADTVYGQFSPEEQAIARHIFLRLTELGEEGAQDTRRRAAPGELVRGPEEARTVERVLMTLADARLITTGGALVPSGNEGTVEVAHEALIREWPALRAWLEEDREGLRTHRHLTEAALGWERLDKDTGELYRGARLAAAGEWAETHGEALNPLEREFLEASKELAWRREAEQEAQRQRELEAAQKLAEEQKKRAEVQARAAGRLRQRALLLAGAMVVALILAVLAVLAFYQADQSAESAQVASTHAVSERYAAETAQALEAEQRAMAEAEGRARATQQAVAEQESREALEAYSLSLAANARQALDAGDTATALVLALAANRISDPPLASQLMLQDAAFAPGPRVRLSIAETFGPTLGRSVASLVPHGPVVLGPDGRLALVGTTATAFLYDTETRQIVSRLEGHAFAVRSGWFSVSLADLAFSPDGRRALSGGLFPPRTLILWDLAEGRKLLHFPEHSAPVFTVDFSPDGSMAVSGGSGSIALQSLLEPGELIFWDTDTGQEIRRCTGGHRNGVLNAAFSPDGHSLLASSGASSIVVIAEILSEGAAILSANSMWVEDSEYDLVLWDVEGCEIIHRFETESHDNYRLAIGPQGDWALTASMDRNIYRWDLRTGELADILQAHQRPVLGLALSSDGRTALSGDTYGHRLILWDVERGEPRYYLKADEEESWLSYDLYLDISPDARRGISSALDGTLVLWDLVDARAPRRLLGHVDQVADLAFTPDGQVLVSSSGRSDPTTGASADDTIRLWDVQTGAPVRVLSGHAAGVTSLSVSPDGRQLLSGSMDKTVRLWDLETGQEIRQLRGHGAYVTGVAFEPDGRTALSMSGVGAILEWDLVRGAFTASFGASGRFASSALAVSPDGGLALSGGAGEDPINIWDMETYWPAGRFRAHEGPDLQITALSISPQGDCALSGDSGGAVFYWEIASGTVLHRLTGHAGAIVDASFGPDGKRALICDQGGGAILWDLPSGSPLGLFTAPNVGPTHACALSPDGQLGAIGVGNEVILWQIATPTLDELLDWIEANRYVRDLTCQERELYRIEPLCEE